LLKFSNPCPPSDTHACVSEKVRATPFKNWSNLKRFNTILKSEIFAESHTQNEMFERSISIVFLHWQH